MQAWDQVKISNLDSEYVGRAGFVVRVETKNGVRVNEIQLDATDTAPVAIVGFMDAELTYLGGH